MGVQAGLVMEGGEWDSPRPGTDVAGLSFCGRTSEGVGKSGGRPKFAERNRLLERMRSEISYLGQRKDTVDFPSAREG